MTLELTRPEITDVPAGWRGPHDPPGSNFRAAQTFDFYGYWPRDIKEVAHIASAIAPELLPVEEPKPEFGTCPVLALIEARMLVESAVGNRGDWSVDEIRPYIDELQLNLDSLRLSLDEADSFAKWMEVEGLV